MIDPRLLDCASQQEVEENFNRLIAMHDTLAARVTALDTLAVLYDANTGTGTVSDNDSPYAVGATVTVLDSAFTPPEGKVFSKWNTAADGSGTDHDPEDEITVTAAMRGTTLTLYAIWADA